MSLNPPSTGPARSISFAWFAVAVLVAAGAAVAATAAYFEIRQNHPSASATTMSLTDDVGRTVNVPVNPSRVAVLSPSIMDSMYRLGLRSHVVAVDCYSAAFGGLSADYSSDQVSLWNLSSSMCVQVGPTLNVEQLLAVSPQLVLASTIISVADVEEISTTYGIPVLILQPTTLSGIVLDVDLLGSLFHASASASLLSADLALGLGNATRVAQNLTNAGTPFPTVMVTYSPVAAGSPSPGYYSFGPGTFGTSLIELASATSISANSTLPYPELSGSAVLAARPQFIVYGTGFGLGLPDYAQGPDWSSFAAVQSGRAIGLNSNFLTEPDPTMILDGLPALLALFHPGVPV
ncbi:MAG: ABC transporter substrate-binding protein [Thermoplasmata archaeon]|nr:ABC transporter substrate-binding protein [Thermoplasmata archaeon]